LYTNVPVESSDWESIASASLTANKRLLDGDDNDDTDVDKAGKEKGGAKSTKKKTSSAANKKKTSSAANKKKASSAAKQKKASSAVTTKAIAKGNSKRNAKQNAKQKMVPPTAVKVKVEPVDKSKETDDDNDDGDDIDGDDKAALFAAIGTLHDVPAKGNCGYDALHRGLALANIDVPECPHQHRKSIFDYAAENEIMLR
jgi:hypothetical protein